MEALVDVVLLTLLVLQIILTIQQLITVIQQVSFMALKTVFMMEKLRLLLLWMASLIILVLVR